MSLLVWFGIMAQCTLSAWVFFKLAEKTSVSSIELSLQLLGTILAGAVAVVLIVGGVLIVESSNKNNKLHYINKKCETEFTHTDLVYNGEFVQDVLKACSEKTL